MSSVGTAVGGARSGANGSRTTPGRAPSRWQQALVLLGLLVLLAGYDHAIWRKERLLAAGAVLRLELAPRDPRALLTGDYMALNYSVARDAQARLAGAGAIDGFAVVTLDARQVATFNRLQAAATPLAAGELALRYRLRAGSLRIGTDAWYFEEGSAERFAKARFGEYRVDAAGEMLLTGMLDAELAPLR